MNTQIMVMVNACVLRRPSDGVHCRVLMCRRPEPSVAKSPVKRVLWVVSMLRADIEYVGIFLRGQSTPSKVRVYEATGERELPLSTAW